MNKQTLFTRLILLVVIVVLANIISAKWDYRLDLTKNKRFTLSEGTQRIASNLEDPVTIKAYVSTGVDPDADYVSEELFNILAEFEELSNGNIVVQHIEPDLDDQEQVASIQAERIQPINSAQQKTGELNQKIYFCGITIEYGEQKEVIPSIQKGMSLEYPIARAVKKLVAENKPKIGIATGSGAPDLNPFEYILNDLRVNFEPVPLDLSGGDVSIDQMDALLLIDHQDSMSAEQLNQLDDFMAAGKSIILIYGNHTADIFNQQGSPMAGERNMPIESWLNKKGINIDDNLVRETNALFDFYYLPMIQNFADHPTTDKLNLVGLNLPSTISYSGNAGTFTPLMFTGQKSGTDPLPHMLSNQKQWVVEDFPLSNLPVAGLYQEGEGKLLVVASKNFLDIKPLEQYKNPFQQETYYALVFSNINFIVNSFDWMMNVNDLAESRSKVLVINKFEKPEDVSTINWYKYTNFLLPVFLVILYGLFRFRARKAKRLKWQTMNFEK